MSDGPIGSDSGLQEASLSVPDWPNREGVRHSLTYCSVHQSPDIERWAEHYAVNAAGIEVDHVATGAFPT